MSELIESFNKFYYNSEVWNNTYWMGIKTLKCPLDLWIYQELIAWNTPELIIEVGSGKGGTTLFLAHITDILKSGTQIVSVDIQPDEKTHHPRIEYLLGDCRSSMILKRIEGWVRSSKTSMVILDCCHDKEHVAEELKIYPEFVTPGYYLIVEDTNVSGPKEAVNEFLEKNKNFEVIRAMEKHFLTFNPGGYLRRRYEP